MASPCHLQTADEKAAGEAEGRRIAREMRREESESIRKSKEEIKIANRSESASAVRVPVNGTELIPGGFAENLTNLD